jgi:hypothetical protein
MGERAGGHRRFGASGLARPRTAPALLDPVADRPSSSWTLRWLPRRSHLVVGSEPSRSTRFSNDDTTRARPLTATAAAGMAISWRTGRQHLNRDREHDRLQSVNYRTGRPIPHRRARPVISCRSGVTCPPAPGQRSRSRLCATRCKRSTHRRMLVEPSPTPTSGPLHAQQPGGLAAQPVPGRPGRGRTGLPARRAARQRQRRRGRAGHHLAVAAQGVHSPRPGHAGPQPRGRPPAGHRRRRALCRPACRAWLDPVFVTLNPGQLPARRGPPGRAGGCGCAGRRRSRRSATAPWSS